MLLVVLLLGLGLFFLWLGRRIRLAALPDGRVVTQDTFRRRRAGESLYDPVLDLAGRPDYLLEQGDRLIPIEIKSGKAHSGPRPSHRLQLAAYCRLIESVYARRPAYGVLQYANRAYAVDYSRDLEQELTRTLQAMRADLGQEPDRSHQSTERCRACRFLDVCDQALA